MVITIFIFWFRSNQFFIHQQRMAPPIVEININSSLFSSVFPNITLFFTSLNKSRTSKGILVPFPNLCEDFFKQIEIIF